MFSSSRVSKIRSVAADTYAQIDDVLDEHYAALFRDHPFLEPKDQILWLRKMLEQRNIRETLHLNWKKVARVLSQSSIDGVKMFRRTNYV